MFARRGADRPSAYARGMCGRYTNTTGPEELNDRFRVPISGRMEPVASKPAFRALIPKSSRRALQLADGYFEWLKPEKRSEPRQPFFFQVDGGIPFAFAALWTPANVGGEWVESITLLTCDSASNPVAAAI